MPVLITNPIVRKINKENERKENAPITLLFSLYFIIHDNRNAFIISS